MWRFWRELPPKGKIGILFGSWYSAPIVSRALGQTDDAGLNASLEEIVRLEKMLCDEGVLLLKFWFHLSKKQQKTRMQELEKDPHTRWRVTKFDWERFRMYDAFRKVSERAHFVFSQASDRPARYGASRRLDTMPSRCKRQAAA